MPWDAYASDACGALLRGGPIHERFGLIPASRLDRQQRLLGEHHPVHGRQEARGALLGGLEQLACPFVVVVEHRDGTEQEQRDRAERTVERQTGVGA